MSFPSYVLAPAYIDDFAGNLMKDFRLLKDPIATTLRPSLAQRLWFRRPPAHRKCRHGRRAASSVIYTVCQFFV